MSTIQTNKRVLPVAPVEPTIFSPKVLMLYGMPKVGKTEALSFLDGCLTLDCEGGTRMYKMLKEDVYSTGDVLEIISLIEEKGRENYAAGKRNDDLFPYKFLAVDTIDKLEEYCLISATQKFKRSTIGKNFQGGTIMELDHGLGYYYLREEIKEVLNKLNSVCKHLILISHVNDKNLDKDGVTVNSKDITMSGKLKVIIPSLCDAIGYLYRKPVKKGTETVDDLWVNFRTSEDGVMGSRFKWLTGRAMEFNWKEIYPDTLAS